MDKTEGSEVDLRSPEARAQDQQAKRPSARRHDADLAEQQPAAGGKRVHARRANAPHDRDASGANDRNDADEARELKAAAALPTEAAAHAVQVNHSNPRAEPSAARPAVAARVGRAPTRPSQPAPARSQERMPQPSAAAPVVWHSDAAAPSREREPDQSPKLAAAGSALARTDLSDDFGLDADYEARLRPWLESLCRRYFRVEVRGAQNVPSHGRALLVANHSRSLLWDGLILRTALRLHHDRGREARWLVDDQQYHAPFLGTFINRLGAVRACQENAERLLRREELVAVFPEGAKAAEKPYEERYRLHRFGRGGYVKLALRTGAPVLPVAIVATVPAERNWLDHLGSASRMLGAPLFALRPSLPRLGQLGVPPLATHVRIIIGEPVREIARQDVEATRDDGLVHELNEFVRGAVQTMVDENLRAH
jgi:1-acyl-sn-glycerol-3-phosphate acyltransferase